ncbi:hypothetical protein ABPG72_009883 [Tetrahymena utriculariae]
MIKDFLIQLVSELLYNYVVPQNGSGLRFLTLKVNSLSFAQNQNLNNYKKIQIDKIFYIIENLQDQDLKSFLQLYGYNLQISLKQPYLLISSINSRKWRKIKLFQ